MEIVITYMKYRRHYESPSSSDRWRPSQNGHRCLIWPATDWNVNEAFWSTAALSVKLAFKLISLFVQSIKKAPSSSLMIPLWLVPHLLLCGSRWFSLACINTEDNLRWKRWICWREPNRWWALERNGNISREQSDYAWKTNRTMRREKEQIEKEGMNIFMELRGTISLMFLNRCAATEG